MRAPDSSRREHLDEGIARRRERRERGLREGERSLAQNLAMIGALGWLVVLPALAGVALGRWIDDRTGGGLTFTAALLFAGLALGCWLAWKRMHDR
jgi:ATP synthase protein I